MPLSYDSLGVLRGYQHSTTAWIPLLDTRITRQGRQEYYWPVGVYESSFMCIICKGPDRFPQFPRPMIQQVEFTMPFLAMEAGLSGTAEERHYRGLVQLSILERQVEILGSGDAGTKADIVKKRSALDKEALHLMLVRTLHLNI